MVTRKKRRTVKPKGKILWKKIGGGSFTFEGKMIKPNQTFYAYPEQISLAFRDVVIPQEALPVTEPVPRVFTLKEADEEGMYHIVDQNDKPLTQKPLSEEDANTMLESL